MKRGVAREINRLDFAGAQDDVGVAWVEALDLGKHPVVEAQLVYVRFTRPHRRSGGNC